MSLYFVVDLSTLMTMKVGIKNPLMSAKGMRSAQSLANHFVMFS